MGSPYSDPLVWFYMMVVIGVVLIALTSTPWIYARIEYSRGYTITYNLYMFIESSITVVNSSGYIVEYKTEPPLVATSNISSSMLYSCYSWILLIPYTILCITVVALPTSCRGEKIVYYTAIAMCFTSIILCLIDTYTILNSRVYGEPLITGSHVLAYGAGLLLVSLIVVRALHRRIESILLREYIEATEYELIHGYKPGVKVKTCPGCGGRCTG